MPKQSNNLKRDHPFHLRFKQGRLFPASVEAKQTIEASASAVWRTLIDFDAYEVWNPFTPKVRTSLKVGEEVHMDVRLPGRSPQNRKEWVNLVERQQTICWGMHIANRHLLTANRWQILTPLSDGRTEYWTIDRFSGLFTPLVMALYGKSIRLGFQAVADNLKLHVESIAEKTE